MALDLQRIKALCFDVDGTLSDTDDQFVHNLARIFHPVRFLFPGRDPRPFSRRVVMFTETPANFLYGIPDALGVDDHLAVLGDFLYRLGLGKTSHPFRLIKGVQLMLERLHQQYPLSVVSARGKKSTLMFLEEFQLRDYFQVIVTARTCRHTKPYPDPILHAARVMGVEPEECLMIGDTTVDMRAANTCGAQAVGVLCGFGIESELLRTGSDLILPETSILAEILNPVEGQQV